MQDGGGWGVAMEVEVAWEEEVEGEEEEEGHGGVGLSTMHYIKWMY